VVSQIDFKANDRIREVLANLGRTEDLRFSPDNRLLAIAGFGRSRCLILRIDIEHGPTGPRISIDDYMELTSAGIGEVHGIDFIDDRTLAIANRNGLVAILRLPEGELAGRRCRVEPVRQIRGSPFCKLETPGSIAVRREVNGKLSLLVCNNYAHRVTRHVLSRRSYRPWRNRVLLKRGLDLPDGLALSHNGQWIAISSHNTHDIKMFYASAPLGPETEPAGILRDAVYPHGLRFTADDRHILVADSGSPVIYVYDCETDWRGSRAPSRSIVVLDDETFMRGRTNIQEGGPKGVDIDRSNNVVAITCEEQTLAFFPLAAILGDRPTKAAGQPTSP